MKAPLFALILLLAGCGGSVQPVRQTSSATARSGIVFVGDSVIGRLTAESQFNQAGYIDAGVFGQRTDEVLARLPDILSGVNVCRGFNPPEGIPSDPDFPYECTSLSAPPKTIVILTGWNNMFQGANLDYVTEMTSDVQKIVELGHAAGVNVVICTLYPWDTAHPASWMAPTGNAPVTFYDMWRIPFNESLKQIPGVTIVDLDATFAGQSDYTADGIHPTFGAGNIEMLNAIQAKL
jgi:hypothetical protein